MVKDHSDSEREETSGCHMGYSLRLAARVLLYASSQKRMKWKKNKLINQVGFNMHI